MLRVNHSALQKMKVHAGQAYPEECCGMLLGNDDDTGRLVYDVVEMRNEQYENRARRFLITPEEYRQVEEDAAKRGLGIIGLYHSHPDHPAEPSQFDLDHALPWWSYMILSVERERATTVRSWVLLDDRRGYDEEEVRILGDDTD